MKQKAIVSLVLGILSLICWIFPLLGFPVSIIGIVNGNAAKKGSEAKGMAKAGMISIIGLVLTSINSALGAYMGATGQMPIFH